MHSALFVASIPRDLHAWEQFTLGIDAQLKNAKDVTRIAENVWLLHFQESISPVGWLIALADRQEIAYGLLPFERAPEWLPAGFDPDTIRGRISH